MSIESRLDRLEEALGPELVVDSPMEDLGPATLDDVLVELVAHVRWNWSRCVERTIMPLDDFCRPVERIHQTQWAHYAWRPGRPRGDLPAREDLFLERWRQSIGFQREQIPTNLDELSRYEREEWQVCDLWTGGYVCDPWEWHFFELLLSRSPRESMLLIEPQQRPLDWHIPAPGYASTFTPRSARARYSKNGGETP